MQRLVLFDIDGTLLSSGGAAARAFRTALTQVFGTSGPTAHSFAGKTDPQIAQELLERAGLDAARVERGLAEAWSIYIDRLRQEIRAHEVTVYPGVRRLLDTLEAERARAVLGLLTGNLAEGARIKLDAAGLGFERFRVGAFGSDHARRPELPAIAVARAEQATGRRFERKDVVIIGDTPADIDCGAHLQVRTIAVATGSYSRADLAACGPDHLFEDLADTDAVLQAIFADPDEHDV
jgi:phosphoglycolate phosphatase